MYAFYTQYKRITALVFFGRTVSAFVVSLDKDVHHLATYEKRYKRLGWPDLSARRDYLSLIDAIK